MFNPSYLIKSRHDVYYFRYPLPIKAFRGNNRVNISLKTRCPKEALRLAKALEYHSGNLIAEMDLDLMDHADIMSIFKTYYAEVLERAKAEINKDGPLSNQRVQGITNYLNELNMLIEDGSDDMLDYLGAEYEDPEQDPLKLDLQKIMDRHEMSFAPESKEYGMLKTAYKHGRRGK